MSMNLWEMFTEPPTFFKHYPTLAPRDSGVPEADWFFHLRGKAHDCRLNKHNPLSEQEITAIFNRSMDVSICKGCIRDYFDRHSTVCAVCEEPIHPASKVADAWTDAPRAYTHILCAEDTDLCCGMWGERFLITLHELDPERFKVATRSVRTYIAKMRANNGAASSS